MTQIIEYHLEVLVLTGIFSLFYQIFFRKLTFFQLNRFILLLMLMVAFVAPLLHIETNPIAAPALPLFVTDLETTTILSQNANAGWTFFGILSLIYQIGILCLGLYMFQSLRNTLRLFRSSKKISVNHQTIYISNSEGIALSFFNRILISKSMLDDDGESLIKHESTHMKQQHSIDLMILKSLQVFQWFNPFLWIFNKFINENHEYIADQETSRESSIFSYQDLMLRHATGIPVKALVHQFTNVSLKRRFKMLLIKRTSKTHLLKYVLLFPLIGMMGWIVSCDHTEESAEETKAQTSSEKTIEQIQDENPEIHIVLDPENQPRFTGGEQARIKYLSENITYPEEAQKNGIQGTVFIQFIINKDGSIGNAKVLKGIGHGCDAEALRVVKNMPNWKPGMHEGEPIAVELNMPISFRLN